MVILDVTDAYSPVVVEQSALLPGYARDVAVAGGYAHVADYGGGLVTLRFTGPGPPPTGTPTGARHVANASADTFVLSSDPNTNYNGYRASSGEYVLSVGSTTGSMQAYLIFDLSPLGDNPRIDSARLHLTLASCVPPSTDAVCNASTFTAYRIASSWSAGSVTWNTHPSLGSGYSTILVPPTPGPHEWDLTNLVKGWVNSSGEGMLPVALIGPENTSFTDAKFFYSQEQGGSVGPILIVDFTATSPTPTRTVTPTRTPQPISTVILASIGGSLRSNDQYQSTLIDVGTSAFITDSLLTYSDRAESSTGSLVSVHHGFELSAIDLDGTPVALGEAITVTIHYQHNESGPGIESTLQLYRLDKTGWVTDGIAYTLDAGANLLTSLIDRLGRFAVLGETNRVFMPVAFKSQNGGW